MDGRITFYKDRGFLTFDNVKICGDLNYEVLGDIEAGDYEIYSFAKSDTYVVDKIGWVAEFRPVGSSAHTIMFPVPMDTKVNHIGIAVRMPNTSFYATGVQTYRALQKAIQEEGIIPLTIKRR